MNKDTTGGAKQRRRFFAARLRRYFFTARLSYVNIKTTERAAACLKKEKIIERLF